MNEVVLIVDDDEMILRYMETVLTHYNLNVRSCRSPLDALLFFEVENIAVVVSDDVMPGMTGAEFLRIVKDVSPATIRILTSGNAEYPATREAITGKEIFKFIAKPWKNYLLVNMVKDALCRYRLLRSMKENNEQALRTAAELIEQRAPHARGHCSRVATYALMIADELELSDTLRKNIEMGAWLHDCGNMEVPETILTADRELTTSEYDTIKKHPDWGASAAAEAAMPDSVVKIIRHHHERFDGKGYPECIEGRAIPLEARIVSVADIFDAVSTNRPYRKGYDLEQSMDTLEKLKEKALDPEIVDVFCSSFQIHQQRAFLTT